MQSSNMPKRNKFSYLAPRKTSSHLNKPRRKILPILTAVTTVTLVLLIAGLLFSLFIVTIFSKDLPSPSHLVERDQALSTKIYDRDGELLYDVYGDQNRTLVRIEDIPPDLIDATLATEDADFYQHRGFDFVGIGRAFFGIITKRSIQGGGSTITQQLVKNALLTDEKTFTRKIKELLLALQIENKYSKEEILQMYLNEVSYGGQARGVEAAAETYFGKKVKELNLTECTLLAGLPQQPSVYSPFGPYPENARSRQSYVLHLMTDKGWIGKEGSRNYLSKQRAEDAKREPLKYVTPGGKIKAPHFVMYVKRFLIERYGEKIVEEGGLAVKTSLSYKMQAEAEKIVAEEIEKAKDLKVGNGALTSLDPLTGEILVMIGSKDYFDLENSGNFNVAADGLRQPGSAIKPINYVTAFRKGFTPASMIMDVPTTFPGGTNLPDYEPENYNGTYQGPIQLRYALGNSINIVAVKLLQLVGLPAMLEMSREMGITTLNESSRYGLSLTLGGGEIKLIELAAAYAVFANGGLYREPIAILEVKNSQGQILEKSDKLMEMEGQKVLSKEEAYLISNILSDNNARSAVFGTYSPLVIPGHTVAVKTGTTDDKHDNWTMGYTPSLVVGVWVGNNDNSPMDKRLASGISGAAPIWHRAMVEFLKDKKDEPFKRPEGIVDQDIDTLTGLLPYESALVRREIFIKETVPNAHSDMYEKLKICKNDGKIAGRACEESGNTEDKIYIKLKDALPEWQPFVDKWLEQNRDKLAGEHWQWYPPTETSALYFEETGVVDYQERPLVKLSQPETGVILADVISPFTVLKVEFFMDGEPLGPALTSIPYRQMIATDSLTSGSHRLKVLAHDSAGNIGEKEIILPATAIGGPVH